MNGPLYFRSMSVILFFYDKQICQILRKYNVYFENIM